VSDKRWARVLTPTDLGRFLAELRIERDLTQAELAEALGVSRRYIYEIESAKSSLYTERLFSLLRLLGARLSIEAEVPVDSSAAVDRIPR
jgi:transcriptional regulator with XRE-family HTH domain